MNIDDVIMHVAKKMNKTPQEVEREMNDAISQAMKSTDPEAQRIWKQLAPDGKQPSIETVINYCVGRIRQKDIS